MYMYLFVCLSGITVSKGPDQVVDSEMSSVRKEGASPSHKEHKED